MHARLASIKFPVWTPYALLILAVLLAYANVYRNAFVYDDFLLISDNAYVKSWHFIGRLFVTTPSQGGGHTDPYYRPLLLLVYMAVYQLAGASTIAFHLLNVALHALNTCLLYTLGRRLGFHPGATLAAAALWALHPVQTEAVTYMSGTADLLCGAFMLGGIVILTQGFGRRRMAVALTLMLFALLCKETAIMFPMLVMGLQYYRAENRWSLKSYRLSLPFWVLALIYLAARLTVLRFNGGFSYFMTPGLSDVTRWDRTMTFLATLPLYLRLLVWPADLHMERSFPLYMIFWAPQVLAGLAIVAAAVFLIIGQRAQRATPLAWGLLWAGAIHAPQSGIVMPADAIVYEHWLYLPTAGLFLGLAETLLRAAERFRFLLALMATAIACLFIGLTWMQNRIWRDPVAFYQHILACGEDNARTRNNLGRSYDRQGDPADAIKQYRLALAFSDDYALAHYNLGVALINSGDGPESIASGMRELQRALALDPNYVPIYEAITQVYAHNGDRQQEKNWQAKTKAARVRNQLPR